MASLHILASFPLSRGTSPETPPSMTHANVSRVIVTLGWRLCMDGHLYPLCSSGRPNTNISHLEPQKNIWIIHYWWMFASTCSAMVWCRL